MSRPPRRAKAEHDVEAELDLSKVFMIFDSKVTTDDKLL
jgi:hypothetical protein